MAATTSSLSTPILLDLPKSQNYTNTTIVGVRTNHNCLYQPLISSLTLSKQIPLRKPTLLRVSASQDVDAAAAAVIASETPQEIVAATSTGGDTASTIVSALLLIAFVALSILTIGVVYIGVTDFLQKREKERFEKEEAANKKKKSGKKKVAVRAKGGPRGFGQKNIVDDDFDD